MKEAKKRCGRCRKYKPANTEAFGPSKQSRDGLKCYCKACDNELHALRYPKERAQILGRMKKYYRKERIEQLEARKQAGTCYFCEERAIEGQTRCVFHLEKAKAEQSIRTKRYWAKLKREVLEHYGKQCTCCGEKNAKFLTLDHVKGDGGAHRLEVLNQGMVSVSQWLRKHGFPSGIVETMCFNCNCGRQNNGGICPHKEQAA